MPDWIGPAIRGASQILGQGINSIFGRRSENRQHRRNIQYFNMQNEYNSPKAMMGRLKEAGLNPDLAVGGANQSSAAINPTPSFTPQSGIGEGVSAFMDQMYNNEIKSAQVDQIRKSIEAQDIENALKVAQTDVMMKDLGWREEDRKFVIQNFKDQQEAHRESVRTSRLNRDILTNQDKRAAKRHKYDIENSLMDILTKKHGHKAAVQALKQAEVEYNIRSKDWELYKDRGIAPGSPPYWKLLSHLVDVFTGYIENKRSGGLQRAAQRLRSRPYPDSLKNPGKVKGRSGTKGW